MSDNSIAKSVMQVNEIVLGSAASTAMATMYITMAQAAGLSSLGTVATQQNRNILGTATIAAGTGNLLWSGMNEEVAELSVRDRLSNWEKMMNVSENRTSTHSNGNTPPENSTPHENGNQPTGNI